MANKKTQYKTITHIPGQIRFILPNGTKKTFNNSSEAQQFFDDNYGKGYSMEITSITDNNGEVTINGGELPEVTVVGQAPKKKPESDTDRPAFSPHERRGVDKWIGANYSSRFNRASARLGMNPLNWPKHIPKSYWDSDTHKAINEGNNIAAGVVTTPFLAYSATQTLPWLAETAPYLSARGWLGATQAAGNTPAWLTPTSATAIDAALAGSATGASINDMVQNGPTAGNVLGTVLGVGGLGVEAASTIMEGINAARQGYNTARDFLWLGKTYNNVGTGLKNPWVRKRFWDLAKNPSLSRNFIETYSRSNDAGFNLAQIKEAVPQLQQLQREFGITPQAQFNGFTPISEQVGKIRSGLQDARSLANGYTEGLEFLKGKNQVLYDIARESPQYLDQIVNDFKSGNITNLEKYVKSLIRQSNTFVRRMNLKTGADPVEAFSEIRGHSMGKDGFAMDIGNPDVVYHPIWSKGYGNQAALYTPREVNPQGPVETWWSQRIPKFQDQSISIDANGMHTGRDGMFNSLNSTSQYNANRYLRQQGIPQSYGRTSSHMIFMSPNEGASISDQFNITPYSKIPNLRYTLGYQKGGKLCKKLKNI